jgi:hypothetical protein
VLFVVSACEDALCGQRMMPNRTLLWLFGLVMLLAHGGAQFNLKEADEVKTDTDKEVVLNVRKEYGDEGDHVSYDELNRPFIRCHKYNPAECDPAKDPSCAHEEKCYPGDRQERLACMAVFTNTSQGLQMSLKGCYPQDEDQLRDCGDRQCLADPKSRSMMFCCCRTHLCNARVGVAADEPPVDLKSWCLFLLLSSRQYLPLTFTIPLFFINPAFHFFENVPKRIFRVNAKYLFVHSVDVIILEKRPQFCPRSRIVLLINHGSNAILVLLKFM